MIIKCRSIMALNENNHVDSGEGTKYGNYFALKNVCIRAKSSQGIIKVSSHLNLVARHLTGKALSVFSVLPPCVSFSRSLSKPVHSSHLSFSGIQASISNRS